jgi:hypothetical protein
LGDVVAEVFARLRQGRVLRVEGEQPEAVDGVSRGGMFEDYGADAFAGVDARDDPSRVGVIVPVSTVDSSDERFTGVEPAAIGSPRFRRVFRLIGHGGFLPSARGGRTGT